MGSNLWRRSVHLSFRLLLLMMVGLIDHFFVAWWRWWRVVQILFRRSCPFSRFWCVLVG